MLGLANCTLCESFAFNVANSPKNIFWSSSSKRSTPRSSLAGGDIAKSGIGKLDHETFTQGAVGQAEHIALFKPPSFIVRFGDTGIFMFVSVMLYGKWSSFNVKSLDPGRAKDAEGPLCVTQLLCMTRRMEG